MARTLAMNEQDMEREELLNGLAADPSQTPPPPMAPGMQMYGNQPGVPTASGGTMQVQTDFDKLGPERYNTTSYAPGSPEATAQLSKLTDTPPTAPASKTYAMEGWDQGKIDRGHDSPKYQIRNVLQNFDPSQGITPDVLAALNALGIGTFTGGKDKIHVGGQYDPRFEDSTSVDVVRGFHGPGGGQAWQFGALNGKAAAPQAAPQGQAGGYGASGGGASSMSGINALFPTDVGTYQALQDQIRNILGGQEMFDQQMLMSMLKR
jgi:hypothetical protein